MCKVCLRVEVGDSIMTEIFLHGCVNDCENTMQNRKQLHMTRKCHNHSADPTHSINTKRHQKTGEPTSDIYKKEENKKMF